MASQNTNSTHKEMPTPGVSKDRLDLELNKVATNTNGLAANFVLLFFLVPTIPDMVQFPDDWLTILIGRLIAMPFLVGVWWMHRQGKITGYWLGAIMFSIVGLHSGTIFQFADAESILAVNFGMFAFLIGLGFFILLKPLHLSVILVFTIGSMLTSIFLADKYGPTQWAEQGAVLTVLGIGFSIMAVQVRLRLQSRAIGSQLALADSQAILDAQNKELEQAKRELESSNVALEQKVTERTASLRKSHSEMDAVIYRLSHDFKMPMVNVRSLLLMAREEAKGEAIERIFGMIESSLDNFDGVMEDMNRFVAFSNRDIALAHCSLEKLLDQVWKKANDGQQEELELEIQGPFPTQFQTDPSKLELVLDCLFRNAYQYRREDKKGKITVRGRLEGQNLRIEIHDNGMGIHPEVLPKIFDLFFRGNTRSKGLGIGLYLAKGIMDQLGGELVLSSDEHGTTAMILLPGTFSQD